MSEKFDGLYDIRSATKDDKNFILKSFLLGLYYGDTWFSKIPKRVFMDNYKRVAEAIFYRNLSSIKVACLIDDPTVILGYAILNPTEEVLHFVYVKGGKREGFKEGWRRKGIATKLIPSTVNCITHLTGIGEQLLNRFKEKPLFNPFAL